MRNFDYIICGNNVAALAAAVALGKSHRIAIVNPSPNWGGIFSGIKINDERFDIGMCFLEFESFYPQSDDLMSYLPAVHNDSARFSDLVRDFYTRRADFVRVEDIKMLWQGSFRDDLVVANQLKFLSTLPGDIKKRIVSELDAILASERSPLHAANKKLNRERFLAANYHEVSLLNHGATLNELLFSPYCQKVLGIPAKKISALLHRVAWCPLYYPETLRAALCGEELTMPEPDFHYPREGGISGIIEILVSEINANENITPIRDKIVGLSDDTTPGISFANEQMTARKIIWSNDLQQLNGLLTPNASSFCLDKSSMTLLFVETERKAVERGFSTLFVCDPGDCVYRVTNQNYMHAGSDKNKFVFEINTGVLEENNINTDGEIIAHVRDFVGRHAIFNTEIDAGQYTVKRFANALTLPTEENIQKFDGLEKALKPNLQNIDCIGPAAGFSVNSLNDQTVAALQLGKKYEFDQKRTE